MTIKEVMERTDWKSLAKQKLELLTTIRELEAVTNFSADPGIENLHGILHWIDAIQDAANEEGYPVVFINENKRFYRRR